jgi:glycine/D-amino acid oxidase-like deaminating enzyme
MKSTWNKGIEFKQYPKLDRDLEADAVIIGGGITGITAAYMLAKAGKKAVLLEKASLSESVSAYTTAFITHIIDTGISEMEGMFGGDTARDVWQSHADAIDIIEKQVKEGGIDCEFMRCSNYMYANDDAEWQELAEEAESAHKYGFDLEQKKDGNIKVKNAGYLEIKNQAKFHPLKYLEALKAEAAEAGAMIFDGTEAEEISKGNPAEVKAGGFSVAAPKVLIATYDPFNKPAEIFAHKGTYTTYIIELSIPSGSLKEGIYEDEENPYHYFRVDTKGESQRVLLGGEDHRHELPLDENKAFAALEAYWHQILPGIPYHIIEKWSGPIIEPADGLALIGTYSEKYPGCFLATGFSGNGMTYGTIAAKMFTEFALGNEIPWKDLYDPTRTQNVRALWQKGKDYIEELARGYGKDVMRNPKGGNEA